MEPMTYDLYVGLSPDGSMIHPCFDEGKHNTLDEAKGYRATTDLAVGGRAESAARCGRIRDAAPCMHFFRRSLDSLAKCAYH
jgi:hypothetical protein